MARRKAKTPVATAQKENGTETSIDIAQEENHVEQLTSSNEVTEKMTGKSKARGAAKKKKIEKPSEDETEDNNVEESVPSPENDEDNHVEEQKSKSAGRKRKAPQSYEEKDDSSVDDVPISAKAQKTKGRKKKTEELAPVEEENEEENVKEPAEEKDVDDKVPIPAKAQKGKGRKKKVELAPVEEEKEENSEEPVEEKDDVEDVPVTTKTNKAKGKKKAEKLAPVEEENEDENLKEEEVLVEESESNDVETGKKTTGRGKSSGQKRGRKASGSNTEHESPSKKTKTTAKSSRSKIPDVSQLKFSNDSKSKSGKKWNVKISSWNVNGIRAWLEKNGDSFIEHEDPDIFCIQETKCSDDKIPAEIKELSGYHCYWLSADKEGYSGVGLMSKKKPKNVEYGIGNNDHDSEGRVITAEFDKFYVVNAYVPNAGRGLVRLDYRMKFDKDFRRYLRKLDDKKRVILCGDLNVAHTEIDLANPKTNKKNAGFTQEERDGFGLLLDEGFVDSFRELYPDQTGAYTFWTYMMNARAKNVGWRLDYFIISKELSLNLCDSVIRKDVFGSDHCPVTLFIESEV